MAASPIVALNRAVALGMRDGPLVGLAALDAAAADRRLAGHPLVPAVRGDLLARAGRLGEAVAALEEAAKLAPTIADRRALQHRAAVLRPSG